MLSARKVRGAVWSMTLGLGAAGLLAVPDGSTARAGARAWSSRACADQHASVRRTHERELRLTAVCLINRLRSRWHLPPLRELGRLDAAAQLHTSEMVSRSYFAHSGPDGSPAQRLDRVGFNWSSLGENISTGYSTAWRAVAGWLGSPDHCRIMLSPVYRDIGIGVSRAPIRGYANRSGTWTADFALGMRRRSPSGNWGPADGCPY